MMVENLRNLINLQATNMKELAKIKNKDNLSSRRINCILIDQIINDTNNTVQYKLVSQRIIQREYLSINEISHHA